MKGAQPADPAEIERLVRATVDAWNSDDWDGILRFAEPDAAIVAPEEWPEQGELVGHDAILRQFERLKESMRQEHAEVQAIEVDGVRALASVVWAAIGEASGLELQMPMWMLYTFRIPRWTRIEYYLDEGKARAAWEAGS